MSNEYTTTKNIGEAVALLCRGYMVVAGDGAHYVHDDVPVKLERLEPLALGRGGKQIFRFVLSSDDPAALRQKAALYQDGVIYVHPDMYDRAKKPLISAMRIARGVITTEERDYHE